MDPLTNQKDLFIPLPFYVSYFQGLFPLFRAAKTGNLFRFLGFPARFIVIVMDCESFV